MTMNTNPQSTESGHEAMRQILWLGVALGVLAAGALWFYAT